MDRQERDIAIAARIQEILHPEIPIIAHGRTSELCLATVWLHVLSVAIGRVLRREVGAIRAPGLGLVEGEEVAGAAGLEPPVAVAPPAGGMLVGETPEHGDVFAKGIDLAGGDGVVPVVLPVYLGWPTFLCVVVSVL